MLELLRFYPEDDHTAGILLAGEYELFNLSLVDWSKEDYIDQWKHAAKHSLINRRSSCFIKNYENAYHHVKMIGIYTIIPEEVANPRKYFVSEEEASDFFITEKFLFITENEKTFTSNDSFDEIEKSLENPFPIFYFNKSRVDKFYLYLSDRIEGISNWRITKEDLESVLDL
ncbi:MAG: hypothetical protein H9855_01155 [Candidatus Acinetobacter avistercoris]|nr:hypothetical protein [Candidatus Acinetobacter avistercoris]